MPPWAWKSYVQELDRCIWLNVTDESNSYYLESFSRNLELTQSLYQPSISTSRIERAIRDLDNGQRAAVKQFTPVEKDLAARTVYSLTSSVTGRMTVKQGPNILTLKKKYRSILQSRWGDSGTLIEIDAQSIEPRVALSLFGKSVDGDVYRDVMEKVNVSITRDAAKIATLAALYGASHHGLKQHLPSRVDPVRVLQEVKEYFGVRHLEKMLKDQHDKLGYIRNTHGRKIFSDMPSVNHMIQSSAVDVSFDIFSAIIDVFETSSVKFFPIYLIHDAIILDIENTFLNKAVELVKDGFYINAVKQKFPVNIKELN